MSDAPHNPSSFRLHDGDAMGFENGEPVAVVWPHAQDDDSTESHIDAYVIISTFLRVSTSGGTALQIGQRMIVLAFLAGQHAAKTKSELAAELKVSPGRISQILAELPSVFHSLARLKSRQS